MELSIILVLIAAALAAGIAIADKTDIFSAFIIYISFIISFIITGLALRKNISKKIVILSVCFLGVVISSYAQSCEMNGLFPVDGKFAEISGYISELPTESNGKYTYIITCDGSKYKDVIYPSKANIMLRTDKKFEFGQNIGAKGFVNRFSGKMNHNSFDYARYSKSKKVFYSITDFETATDNSFRKLYTPAYLSNLLKDKIQRFIDLYTADDDAAVLKAVLTGNKKTFSDEFTAIQERTGTIRFLYSGYLHILLIFTLIELLFPLARRKFKEDVSVAVILVYALFNSGTASLLKTAFVSVFAIIFLRRKGYLHFPDVLSAAVIAILLGNPLMLYSSGFILSVYISWLFFMLREPAYKLFDFLGGKWVTRYISMWFLGTVGTAPVIAYFFDGIAPFTSLFTIIYLPVIAVILVLFPPLYLEILLFGRSFIFAKGILCSVKIIEKLPYIIDSIPLSSIRMASPGILFLILFCLAVILIRDLYLGKAKKLRPQLLGIIIAGGTLSIVLAHIFAIGNASITFVNVGQGDGSIIELPKGERIIVDGGGAEEFSDYDAGAKIFVPYMLDEGLFRVDLAIVTHFHKDHCLGTIAAMKELNVHSVAMPDASPDDKYRIEIEKLANENGIEIIYLEAGDKITFESGSEINVISPSNAADCDDVNDTSIVFELTANNFKALFTGDSTKTSEAEHINEYSHVNLLKVPHHGSDTSSSQEFIDRVSPDFSVISIGENNTYGLPTDTVLDRLKNANSHILRTDKLGDIKFTVRPNGTYSYTSYLTE